MLEGIKPLPRSDGTRAEELVRRLETLILERGPGIDPRLGSKDMLRKQFQVAHGTMNEAVRVLETRGLIELRRGPQGGVFATAPSIYVRLSQVILGLRGNSVSVEQCLAIRNQLEPLTMSEAAKAAATKPEAVKELYCLVARMSDTISVPSESLRWNWLLHRSIAEMGSNSVLTGIYLTLLDFIEQQVTDVAPDRSYVYSARIVQMHRDLVDAIATGDPNKATEAAKNHPLPREEGDDAPSVPATPYYKAGNDDR